MSKSSLPQPWRREAVESDQSWVQAISPVEAEAFDTALTQAKKAHKPLLQMTPDDFPLNQAGRACLARAVSTVLGRWGMCLLRGLPTQRWTAAEAELAYWGMGLHMGVARPQNAASNFMASVRNDGGSYVGKNARGYNTNAGLDFHIDFCDVVGLLCLNSAKSGGDSLVVSSLAVYDEIRRTRPDLFETLFEPFYFHLQGGGGPDDGPWYGCPLAGEKDGHVSFRSNRKNIVAAQRDFPEIPRLTPAQQETLQLLETLFVDRRFCYAMRLAPGDMQLLNNHVVMHSRTEFEDFPDPAQKRHLLRLWLSLAGAAPLPDSWLGAYKDTRQGAVRGGIRGSGITPEFLAYESSLAKFHGMSNTFK